MPVAHSAPPTTETREPLTPERIMQFATGAWVTALVGAAAMHSIFRHLEGGGADAETVARSAGLSQRGAQALLDGLAGVGLVERRDGRYVNGPEASTYLVEGKPAYLGGFVAFNLLEMPHWLALPEVAKSGVPSAEDRADRADNPWWTQLVTSIAGLSVPVAELAAERLGLATAGAIRILDVGGGSGIFDAVWLRANPTARATQLDWPKVNAVAREFVARFGVGDRFATRDGDMLTADFGHAEYDLAVFSHIAHQFPPDVNVEIFTRLKRALEPGGTLVVNDFVLNDDRTGHPFAMMFAIEMLVRTTDGFTYRRADYDAWLRRAGFRSVEFVPTPTPSTLVFAR